MLAYLRIKNFALLENVEMEFDAGLNVITGESGSGKSFILKAVLFLLGYKMPTSVLRSGAESVSVEALFIHNDEELIIRRELSSQSSRSRFFINDVLSSQESIKNIREDLLLYTSQHAQHKLLQPVFHTLLLDTFLGNEDILAKRDTILHELRVIRKQQEELEKKYITLAERRELLEFQQSEIVRVAPSVEEEEELERKKEAYTKIKKSLELVNSAQEIFYGGEGPSLQERIASLQNVLQAIVPFEKEYSTAIEELETISSLLQNIERSLMQPQSFSPIEDIDAIESRLFEFSKLKRSLHRSIEEICAFEHEIADNLSFLDSCELEMKYLKKEEGKYKEELQNILSSLQRTRHDGASVLSKKIEEALLPLGFSPYSQVIFSFSAQEIWEGCFEDKARITFCPNVGHPAMPLDAIASGGELSRFLLAISGIMSTSSSQSLIFDEVDVGIGGRTLQKVAEQLQSLAGKRQLIVVTHWGNVAQYAARHFYVEKKVTDAMTTTFVKRLSEEERKKEIGRMKGDEL